MCTCLFVTMSKQRKGPINNKRQSSAKLNIVGYIDMGSALHVVPRCMNSGFPVVSRSTQSCGVPLMVVYFEVVLIRR